MPPIDATKYKMPHAVVGAALWYPAVGDAPVAAIITDVGSRAVSMITFPPETRVGVIRTGVRHASDPEFSQLSRREGGVWDYTPEQVLLAVLTDLAETQIVK